MFQDGGKGDAKENCKAMDEKDLEVFIQLVKMDIVGITGSLCIKKMVKVKLPF